MNSLRFGAVALIGLACFLAVCVACSSSSSNSTNTPAPTQSSGNGASTLTGTAVATSSATPEPSGSAELNGGGGSATCSQLTNEDIQPLMTNAVVGDDVSAVGTDSDGQQCIYHDADSEQAVDIIVAPASDEVFGYNSAKENATNPVDVAGIGDEAFREAGDDQPTAQSGGLVCSVSLGTNTEIPGTDALIQNGSLDLTETQDGIIAEALGTVCNRIFGSGNTTPDLSGLASS